MTAAQSLELLANACTGYLAAREQLRHTPEGSDEERHALTEAVSALERVRQQVDTAVKALEAGRAA